PPPTYPTLFRSWPFAAADARGAACSPRCRHHSGRFFARNVTTATTTPPPTPVVSSSIGPICPPRDALQPPDLPVVAQQPQQAGQQHTHERHEDQRPRRSEERRGGKEST